MFKFGFELLQDLVFEFSSVATVLRDEVVVIDSSDGDVKLDSSFGVAKKSMAAFAWLEVFDFLSDLAAEIASGIGPIEAEEGEVA